MENKFRISIFLFLVIILAVCEIRADETTILNSNPEAISNVGKDIIKQNNKMTHFFGDITVGYEHAQWEINDTMEVPVVTYRTEGLQVIRLCSTLGYREMSLLDIVYERPITNTPEQNQMFAANIKNEAGLEKFTGGIKLDPIATHFFPRDSMIDKILRCAFSIRFKYTREMYFGEAEIQTDTKYLPIDSTIDYENRSIDSSQLLIKGTKLTFNTTFVESEITVSVSRALNHELRVGYYISKWKRPSDNNLITIENLPIVYEAEYDSAEAVVSLETSDRGAPGFNMDLSFRLGHYDTLKTAFDWKLSYGDESGADSARINIGLWYNWYFTGKDDTGFFASAGVEWSKRAMSVYIGSTPENSDEQAEMSLLIHDVDYLTKFYMNISHRF